jgi:hypothetical protein
MQGNLTEGESCAYEETCVCLQSKDGNVEVIPVPDLHYVSEGSRYQNCATYITCG